MSKPQFKKFRTLYYVMLVYVIGFAIFIGYEIYQRLNPASEIMPGFGTARFRIHMIHIALDGIMIVFMLLLGRYAECPHCGKSVFPFWGSREMLSRILKRKPIICSHCGEEVETGND